jgi:hypothetical protein
MPRRRASVRIHAFVISSRSAALRPEPAVLSFARCRKSGISAENKLMTADNFLQMQQKQRAVRSRRSARAIPAGRPRGCRGAVAGVPIRCVDPQGRRAETLQGPGNAAAYFELILPPHRERTVEFTLPSIKSASDIAAVMTVGWVGCHNPWARFCCRSAAHGGM